MADQVDEFGRSKKRTRVDDGSARAAGGSSTALVAVPQASSTDLIIPSQQGALPSRTSSLEAPIMVLEGHGAAVTGLAFHPSGRIVASSSKDKTVFLWSVGESCTNTAVLKGHKHAVLDVGFLLDGDQLASVSADKTGAIWDAQSGTRIKKLAAHSKIVNAVSCAKRGAPLIATASDDGSTIIWDARRRQPVHTLKANTGSDMAYPVLTVAFGGDSDTVFTGGIDNVVRQWDLRKGSKTSAGLLSSSPALVLSGHSDSVMGMALHPQGTHLATFAGDHQVRAWDVRPYCAAPSRCSRIFTGATQNFEQMLIRPSWSADGERVACGSADRRVWVWDYETGAVEYALPGHSGVVTAAAFSPVDVAILASAGADRKIYLGELSRPQVEAPGQGGAGAGASSSAAAAPADDDMEAEAPGVDE